MHSLYVDFRLLRITLSQGELASFFYVCYGTATKTSSTSKIIDNIDNIPFFNNNTRSVMSVTSKVD